MCHAQGMDEIVKLPATPPRRLKPSSNVADSTRHAHIAGRRPGGGVMTGETGRASGVKYRSLKAAIVRFSDLL